MENNQQQLQKGKNYRHENSIASLISAPLTAVSKANMSMLAGQTRFILKNCFTQEGDSYHPIMVNMSIFRTNGEDGLMFQVPLLCLLPLNSLAVEKVKLDFSVDITTVSSYRAQDKVDLLDRKSVLNGRIVRDEDGKDNRSAHMKVEIDANAIPLPLGLRSLIELYSKTMLPNNESK
jgi:hypothetical protein